MNIKEVLQKSEKFLKSRGIDQSRLDAEVLLSDLLEMERIKLYVNFDYPLTEEELSEYRNRIQKRGKRIPVAYITGHKEFMSLDFQVNESVLLPRPETELLVEEVLEWCEKKDLEAPNIVDVGTGSGAIMVSLGYNLKNAKILGIDIKKEILEVARENIQKYQLGEKLKVIKGDLLKPLIKMEKTNVDVVVSNPPYIKEKDMESLPAEVKKEPEEALNGGKQGLNLYRKLIPEAYKVLKDRGLLALEIGADQAEALQQLLTGENKWENIEIKKDQSERDRMVFAEKNAK